MAARTAARPVFCALFCLFSALPLHASVINIPKDYPSIQQGIDAASRGDTVLVAPGLYFEQLVIQKQITLASHFLITGDASFIGKTTIDGGGFRRLPIWIKAGGSGTTVAGLTITNGLDGIKIQGMATIVDNHIVGNGDGIDYSAVSGGLCARNVIENSLAEGIDIDDKVSIIIEDNIFRYNGTDGIEIQLQNYQDTTRTYIIRRNEIYGHKQDGIQLVEHAGRSNRFFLIERNLIYKNRAAGLGLMGWGHLPEKYLIAAIKDRVHLFNNTFVGNTEGVVGGDNVIAINNLFLDSKGAAMREVHGNSMAAHNLLHGNAIDFVHCRYDASTIVRAAPFLDNTYRYRGDGPGVDQGVASFQRKGQTILDIPVQQYAGSAPDLGAFEYGELNPPRQPATLHVPDDFMKLQDALAACIDGDTVLVAPGEYIGEMRITKNIVLASKFFTTGDSGFIAQTIIDGDGRGAIVVDAAADSGAKIIGLSIRNGTDGIRTHAVIDILHNRITQCDDGIDYEPGGGGLCAFNVIENNRNEGIDLDRQRDIAVQDNLIRNNGTDGIRIQLSETARTYRIHRNRISTNLQNGIRIIDDGAASERTFFIAYNTIDSSGAAGLGLNDGVSDEYFEGASINGRIYLFNNSFVTNRYGVIGGDNLVALNNLVIASKMTAMKNIAGTSIISHCLLWNNGKDFEHCNIDSATILSSAPSIGPNLSYEAGSFGIDHGTAFFVWQGDTVLNMQPDAYVGSAPDIGAFEFVPLTSAQDMTLSTASAFRLLPNYPNPFNARTVIGFELPAPNLVRVRILDLLGREVRVLVDRWKSAGMHTQDWDGLDAHGVESATGLYFYELQAGEFRMVRTLLLVR